MYITLETIDHNMTSCRFLPFAFDTVKKCFLPVDIDGHTVSDVLQLFQDYLDASFMLPAGVMSWLAIKLNRDCQCMACTQSPTWHQFVRLWAACVKRWIALLNPPINCKDLVQFASSLLTPVEGKLLHPKLQSTPPTPPISQARLRKQRKLDKAAKDSLKLDAYLSDLKDRASRLYM